MSQKLKLLILIIVALFMGCKSTREVVYVPTNFKIEFGNSGGFSNVSMDYLINIDGDIFRHEEDKITYVKTISKKRFKELKRFLKSDEFRNLTMKEPGNITYFVKVKCPDFEQDIQWNDQSSADFAELIYDQLISTLKN